MLIVYPVKSSLYLNITNRCPCDCTFCIRKHGDGVYGTSSLWLDHEPSLDEIIAALNAHDLTRYTELVFCGFGEPTTRLDTLLAIAQHVKNRHPSYPIRLNTNGLADLIHGAPTAARLAGLIDTVSISLNAPNAADYVARCRPIFGEPSWQALLDYARACCPVVPSVTLSIVGSPVTTEEEQAKCRHLAESVGACLRIRPYEP